LKQKLACFTWECAFYFGEMRYPGRIFICKICSHLENDLQVGFLNTHLCITMSDELRTL
jgi:hypothetical protein